MALNIQGVQRNFRAKLNGKDQNLDDPNSDFTPDEVMVFYSNNYPELTTATVSGPVLKDDIAVYEFKTTVGTKG